MGPWVWDVIFDWAQFCEQIRNVSEHEVDWMALVWACRRCRQYGAWKRRGYLAGRPCLPLGPQIVHGGSTGAELLLTAPPTER